MDLSILLGVIGIAVSIAVGYGTYWLTERQSRRNRWRGAKDTVLRDLSMSLGEGNVPDPLAILATIRSVLRDHNAPDLAAVTFEEVRDDLVRQITADPFLETERRKQLLTQTLNLQAPQTPSETLAERRPDSGAFASSVGALLAGLVSSVVAGVSFSGVPALFERLRTTFDSNSYLLLIPAVAGRHRFPDAASAQELTKWHLTQYCSDRALSLV